MRPPKISRVHVSALFTTQIPEPILVVHADGSFEITTPATWWSGGRGRNLLGRHTLCEAGVRIVPNSGGHIAPGCGPLVDDIVQEIDSYLASEWAERS